MNGRIIKGIAGFYYVLAEGALYECRAKGVFRKDNLKPLPGDLAEISVLSAEDRTGTILSVFPRKNALVRPEAANVDQILLLFSAFSPAPNYEMLNRYLISVHDTGVPVSLVVTKSETVSSDVREEIAAQFLHTAYPVTFVSAHADIGKETLLSQLKGKTSILAGPSGVGKSSLLNWLTGEQLMETGTLSRKIERGKNTTRHTELFCLSEGTYLLDTPGFTAVELPEVSLENLALYYDEFIPYLTNCRYSSCRHMKEKDCRVKQAVREGLIPRSRYVSYRSVYTELEQMKPY